jgi:phosphoribosylamine--glycine ligase
MVTDSTPKTRVLIVGAGGRGHALGAALQASPSVDEVIYAPGTSGLEYLGFETVPFPIQDLSGLVEHAMMEGYDLTVVGPNTPLVDGIVDRFMEAGLPIFGPTKAAARLEGSKVYARLLMRSLDLPTPRFAIADGAERANFMARSYRWARVFKADGIAYDKGVRVTHSIDEVEKAIEEVMYDNIYGLESKRLVVEERIDGQEVTLFSLTDGEDVYILGNVLNYPRLLDGDGGPPTRGMGQVCPAPNLDEELVEKIRNQILVPTVQTLKEAGKPIRGALFVDLMMIKRNPYVIDYNVRFGDPATQTMLSAYSGDFYKVLQACRQGQGLRAAIDQLNHDPRPRVSLVLVCEGYPTKRVRGADISIDQTVFDADPDLWLFYDGVRSTAKGLETTGARTLTIVAAAETVCEARSKAYQASQAVQFEGQHMRGDIGLGY